MSVQETSHLGEVVSALSILWPSELIFPGCETSDGEKGLKQLSLGVGLTFQKVRTSEKRSLPPAIDF